MTNYKNFICRKCINIPNNTQHQTPVVIGHLQTVNFPVICCYLTVMDNNLSPILNISQTSHYIIMDYNYLF